MSKLQLTDEQQAALREQLAATPPERRVGVPLTPEQAAAYRQAVAEELAGKKEMTDYVRKLRAAEQEPGLFGDLRRAINASRLERTLIAAEIGTTPDELDKFRTADAPLPPEALKRLVDVLGLQLMQQIPARREPVTANPTAQ
jgi:hypothetical protein